MPPCPECGFDWETPAAALPPAIAAIGSRYRQMVLGESDHPPADGSLLIRPEPERWSPLEYLCHMRDVAAFYDQRIQRVLTEVRPELAVGFTFAEVAERSAYHDEDPVAALAALDRTTANVARRLAAVDADQWRRVGIGSAGDQRSVLILARRLAHEARHHLRDIEGGLSRDR